MVNLVRTGPFRAGDPIIEIANGKLLTMCTVNRDPIDRSAGLPGDAAMEVPHV
jgi:hypothetical protein